MEQLPKCDLWKECFHLISLSQLSMHLRTTLHQINAGNNHVTEYHVTEYFWLYLLIQSACPGELTGENYIGVGDKYLELI